MPAAFMWVSATLGLNTRKCLSCKGKSGLRRSEILEREGTSKVKRTQWRPWLSVIAGGELISSAGDTGLRNLPFHRRCR